MDSKLSAAEMIKALLKNRPDLTVDEAAVIVQKVCCDIIDIEVEPLNDEQYVIRTVKKVVS